MQSGAEPEIILDAPLLRTPKALRQTEENVHSQAVLVRQTGNIEIGSSSAQKKKKRMRIVEGQDESTRSVGTSEKKVRFE